MMHSNRHILLVSSLPSDGLVFTQAFENHPDKLKITVTDKVPDNADGCNLILLRADTTPDTPDVYILPSAPIRIGAYMDFIESHLAQTSQMQDITYRDYHFSANHNILDHQGRTIPLTDTETNIIHALMTAGASGLKREDMLASIWQYRPDLDTHTLETHIYRLRQKIEADPTNPQCLVTIPNGYMLT